MHEREGDIRINKLHYLETVNFKYKYIYKLFVQFFALLEASENLPVETKNLGI